MAETSAKKFIPEIKILCGLPASGKSTRAIKWVAHDPNRRVRINYDELRLAAGIKPGTFNRKDEDAIQATALQKFHDAIRLDMSVVIDNMNLTPKARQKWIDAALSHNLEAQVEEVGSHIPIWDIIKRDALRGEARVGRAVIERMALFNGFIDWSNKKDYYCDSMIVCDLDGTLCDISHRKHFVERRCLAQVNGKTCNGLRTKLACPSCGADSLASCSKVDWAGFFANVADDKLNAPVAELLDMFADDGNHILLVSGRPINPCGIPTEDWLAAHDVKYDHLFMRAGGDSRSDVIVKQEILDLLPKDRIDYVLDDRDSVVEMWRKNGLFCMQVAEGAF